MICSETFTYAEVKSNENMEEDITEELAQLRSTFKEKYADSIKNGTYDKDDVDRFCTDDIFASRYYYHQKREIDKALAMTDTSLKWRKSINLNQLTDSSFPLWMHELCAIYYHNKDKDGNEILQFRVARNKKDPDNAQLAKTFIAWWIDKSHKKTPEKPIVLLMDMTGTGLSNMDVDMIKFQVTCFTTYFPYYLEYMLIYEMPWVLNAIWNIIKNLLTAEQQKRVLFVKQKDVDKYISKENLALHMGGSDAFEYTYLPSEDSGIDIPSDEFMTSHGDSNNLTTSSTTLRKRVTFSDKEDLQHPPERQVSDDSSSHDNGPVFKGILANISPREQFVFNVSDETKESLDLLTITNTSQSVVAFKVKTTSPECYRVRPSTSLIQPGAIATVNVYLQPGRYESINRDKFLVMLMVVEDNIPSATEINDRWKSPPQDAKLYMEHRLYCAIKHVRFDESASKIGSSAKVSAVQQELEALNKKNGPSFSNLDSKSSEILDVMLCQQNELERKVSCMYKVLIFVAFLVVTVLIIFALSYLMEWRIVDGFTSLSKKGCNPLAQPTEKPHYRNE